MEDLLEQLQQAPVGSHVTGHLKALRRTAVFHKRGDGWHFEKGGGVVADKAITAEALAKAMSGEMWEDVVVHPKGGRTMTEWHGYPQAEGAHPERPWWRKQWQERGDGSLKHIGWRNVHTGYIESALAVDRARFDLLEYHDREHPLPCPPPRCGQVWVWPDSIPRYEAVLTVVIGSQRFFPRICPDMELRLDREPTWPPPGAVLVAGPGSPWADTTEGPPDA